jgi:hypothetical protein
MRTGWKFKKPVGCLILCVAFACPGIVRPAFADAVHGQRKAKKPTPPPPLPSGPTGPVQQIPLDSIAPVAPQVSYQDSQLTIVAPNSTLGDILRAVRKQTGADIDIPTAPERVVTHLGPGPAREVLAELLNGSRFNYVLLGSPANDAQLTRVVLVAKTGGGAESATAAAPAPTNEPQQVGQVPPGNPVSSQQEPNPDTTDAEAPEDNTDENAEQQVDQAEQATPPDQQPGVKTPQEMLQEMQQRQLMLQQQQPPGQPPIPGAGVQQRPPQEQ